jgi:protein phosphatase
LIGRRAKNEDALAVRRAADATVCVLADGASWAHNGGAASQLVVEVLPRELEKYLPGVLGTDETKSILRRAVQQAHEEVLVLGRSRQPEEWAAGTTIVFSLWFTGGPLLYVAGVGDSRAYHVRGETITQLTVDHSIAQALVQAKAISAAEARTSPWRNVLVNFLGSAEVGEGPEVKVVQLQPGDRFLLCTDGLSNIVSPEQILAFMGRTPDTQRCADGLCGLALEEGSRDNISAIVINVVAR